MGHCSFRVVVLAFCMCYQAHSQYDCTSSDSDTCYIESTTNVKNSGIQYIRCSDEQNCIVTCDGEFTCGDDNSDDDPEIHCPINGDYCEINCLTHNSCRGGSIHSNNCSNVSVKINGNDNKKMNIYAPGNQGTLTITLTSSSAKFKESNVYSHEDTASIVISCMNGDECKNNDIYVDSMINGQFLFECDSNTDCGDVSLYCPNTNANTNNECNIHCGDCSKMKVYSQDGIADNLNWECDNDDSESCLDGTVYCDNDYDTESQWDYSNQEWILSSECGIVPTVNPTPSPTNNPSKSPTTTPAPTFPPSRPPSRFPSVSPSKQPSQTPTSSDVPTQTRDDTGIDTTDAFTTSDTISSSSSSTTMLSSTTTATIASTNIIAVTDGQDSHSKDSKEDSEDSKDTSKDSIIWSTLTETTNAKSREENVIYTKSGDDVEGSLAVIVIVIICMICVFCMLLIALGWFHYNQTTGMIDEIREAQISCHDSHEYDGSLSVIDPKLENLPDIPGGLSPMMDSQTMQFIHTIPKFDIRAISVSGSPSLDGIVLTQVPPVYEIPE